MWEYSFQQREKESPDLKTFLKVHALMDLLNSGNALFRREDQCCEILSQSTSMLLRYIPV